MWCNTMRYFDSFYILNQGTSQSHSLTPHKIIFLIQEFWYSSESPVQYTVKVPLTPIHFVYHDSVESPRLRLGESSEPSVSSLTFNAGVFQTKIFHYYPLIYRTKFSKQVLSEPLYISLMCARFKHESVSRSCFGRGTSYCSPFKANLSRSITTIKPKAGYPRED